jgi:hypothetical protein
MKNWRCVLALLAFASSGTAKERTDYQNGKILLMESTSCGLQEKGSNRAEQFPQLFTHIRCDFPESVENMVLIAGLSFRTCQSFPFEQFTAFTIRLYWVPISAIEPVSTALLPVR